MESSEVRAEVEVRETASELALLAVLGVASMALVAGLAYSVLGSTHGTHETAVSIERAGRLIAGALLGGFVLFGAMFVKPRPHRATAVATPQGMELQRAGKTRRVRKSGLRSVYVVQDRGAFCVELERRGSTIRLIADSQDDAERIAGTLVGAAREPAATARVRRRADYYNFLLTSWMWVVTYACICVLPLSLPLGALLTVISALITAWVTLRAVPSQVLVSARGVVIAHPLKTWSVPSDELAGARVIDDDKVRITLTDGRTFVVPELVDHPHDRGVSTSNPPAERLAAAVEALVAGESRSAA